MAEKTHCRVVPGWPFICQGEPTLTSRHGLRVSVLLLLASFAMAADPSLHINEIQAKKAAIDRPAPAYPMTARQLKITGDVHVDAVVAEDGTVEDVRIETGNIVLTKPAAEAVKKWRFRPFQLNGKPARALVSLSFEFGAR